MSIEFHNPMPLKKNNDKLLKFWSILSEQEQQQLLDQIKQINPLVLQEQRTLIQNLKHSNGFCEAFKDYTFSGNEQLELKGKELLRKGKMGCIILAGGQGTRLRFEGPKGLFPVSVIKQKSLFQLLVEKTIAASKQAHQALSLAIMTSPENDATTKQFFLENNYWGLAKDQVSFFCQSTLPLLSENGDLFLDGKFHIAEGPNGNGQCLHDFYRSGIYEKWKQRGIEHINIVLIDNPLADPFDAELLGFHHKKQAEITIKCTEKLQPQEKVGVVVKENNCVKVVEYSELTDQNKTALDKDGRLQFCCANLSLFCFSMSFIEKTLPKVPLLPLHKAWKAAKIIDEQGNSHQSTHPIAWKFETFIFDWLQHSEHVFALLYPRQQCFAPLKNFQGEDSLESVQNALLNREKNLLESITGLDAPIGHIELSADFYYPTPELLQKWKNKSVNEGYIEP
jgi:UDP-N-acetylglucosamine/UDP-N-acetylgalactosamine diphosphorylase